MILMLYDYVDNVDNIDYDDINHHDNLFRMKWNEMKTKAVLLVRGKFRGLFDSYELIFAGFHLVRDIVFAVYYVVRVRRGLFASYEAYDPQNAKATPS